MMMQPFNFAHQGHEQDLNPTEGRAQDKTDKFEKIFVVRILKGK